MYNKEEYQSLILAALLHDIGKFYQRTGREPQYFAEFSIEDYGEHGAHSKWSASFVKEYLPAVYSNIAIPILYHHKPMDELSKIINKADALSSTERLRAGSGDPKKSRLLPILARIFNQEWDERGFKLNPLCLDETKIFPTEPAIASDLTTEYQHLWENFIKEITRLDEKTNFDGFFNTLLYILQKYTWCIPSAAFKFEPDVSLYDHLKSTAAIAAVLYLSHSNKFRLIGGDISGLQKFLYNIASPDEAQSGMAQRLRGRSFYLSILVETIALFILQKLNLPLTNLIWCGGGNFTILAPESSDLLEIKTVLDEWLLEKYQGELSVVMASIDIDENGFINFGDSLNQLQAEIAKEKLHKFYDISWHKTFEFIGDVCKICGKDTSVNPCNDCVVHEKIGQKIPYSKYLFIAPHTTQLNDNVVSIKFDPLNYVWGLTSSIDDVPPDSIMIFILNTTDTYLGKPFPNTAVCFKFIAQHVPRKNNQILTFQEIQKLSAGGEFLGILRMDVDDLGLIFTFGLGENRTLSRVAALSRSIDLFFSGYLNKLAEAIGDIYLLYSGGDDLFIVGPWNKSVKIAEEIYKKFKEYSGNNPEIHISGGIHLIKHKFPIGIAANIAKEKLEGFAKRNIRNGKEKDSIALFDFAAFWSDALPALEFADGLITFIKEKKLSHSFVYNILQIYWTHFADDGKENPGWVPKFLYHLKRNVPPLDNEGKENIVYNELLTKMPKMIKTTPLWATLALLATRHKI
ncbi:MAG: type III-A CRISPR-associated protein Cas10/Csm1 [candidate division WOR-3 bacterium]